MTDDNPRLHRQLAGLASDWVSAKRRSLQRGQPNTVTDSGGSMGRYSWQGQELDRSELRKVKQMREKGGLVSWLFECKALMKFGTGAELQSENDDLQEWLNENFQRLDLLTLDLGSDGIWYPYGLGEVVETRGGEFSHIECIEPWTMLPRTNEYGEIVVWEQETQGKHNQTSPFQPEEIGSIVLNKSSGRDKVGVSEVLRSEEEITQYKENQRAVNKAIEIAGFPHHVWTVGAEGRSPVDDNDLRRVRNLIDNMDGDTQFVVGPDVDHDKITAADFDFEGVTKRDLRILTTTVGLPMELAGYGREGMGSGSETDLIGDMLALQNEVSRRRFETQFVEEFVRPVVREYSPYSEDEPIDMVIDPFLDERDDVADLIGKIGEYMSTAEVRDKLDLPPLEDEEMAESYRSPEAVEEAEEGDDGGMGGLFGSDPSDTDFRSLQVPDNAVSISDRGEAPEGATVVEGDQGGLYYIPAGEGIPDEQADEIVKNSIADIDIDAEDESMGERATEKYERNAIQNADNIKSPEVAKEMFDNIGELFVNDFRTGINFSAGKSTDTASFEVQASRRDQTFQHEFGHAIADAYGFGVSTDAAREGDIKYDSDEENFVQIDLDRDDVDEFRLTQLEGKDAPEEIESLIEETNNAWEKMQETAAENPDALDDVVVRDNYGSISAHETLAQLHETMQTDRLPTTGHANFFDEHPDLTRAYVDVAEPSDRMKDLLSHLHNDRGADNSPFDEDPYPEREV